MTAPQPEDAALTTSPTPSAAVAALPPPEGMRVTLPGNANPQERWLWRGLIAVLCLLAYVPCLSPNFIWDDDRHAGMTKLRDADGLVSIWTKVGLENGGTPQYYPLTHTTFWLEQKIFGTNAVGFHVVNILIHAGTAVMLWELLKRLRVPGAFLAAAVFALHPIMVESVAWTSERKNTLSLLLAIVSIYYYLAFAGVTSSTDEKSLLDDPAKSPPAPDWNLYILAAVAFVGALLSKTVAGSAPVVLLLILWWKRRLSARHIGLIAPFLIVALGLSSLTAYTEYAYVIRPGTTGASDLSFGSWLSGKLSGSLPSAGREYEMPFSQRLVLAGMVPWFYLYKLVLPITLIFFYPRWDFSSAPIYWGVGLLALLIVVGVAATLAARGKRWPLVVVLGYLAALFPAMGFVDVYPFRYSFVADHFAYHASVILIVAICAGLASLAAKWDARQMLGASAILCLLLAGRTYVHAGNFFDKFALWDHTFRKNPTSWAAANNLAFEYITDATKAQSYKRQFLAQRETKLAEGADLEANEKLAKARELLLTTLALNPDHDGAHQSLGLVAFLENKPKEAMDNFQKSIEVRTRLGSRDGPYATSYFYIGDIYRSQSKWDLAVEYYRKALAAQRPPLNTVPLTGYTDMLDVLIKSVNADVARRQSLIATTQSARESSTRPSTTPSELAGAGVLPGTRTLANPGTGPSTGPVSGASTQASTRPSLATPTPEQVAALIKAARDATEAQPKSTRAWMLGAKAMELISSPVEAMKAYEQAIRLDLANVNALIGYGSMLAFLGDLEGARPVFVQALRLDPNRADARQLLDITTEMYNRQRAATQPTTNPTSRPATSPAAP